MRGPSERLYMARRLFGPVYRQYLHVIIQKTRTDLLVYSGVTHTDGIYARLSQALNETLK